MNAEAKNVEAAKNAENTINEAPANETETSDWPAYLREGVATILAVAVAAVSLTMLWSVFGSAGVPQDAKGNVISEATAVTAYLDANGRQKDIMLYGLSLLGAVMGYYFGRVPAERRAEKAEANADKAQNTANNAQSAASKAESEKTKATEKIAQTRAGMKAIQEKLSAAKTSVRKVLGGDTASGADTEERVLEAKAGIDTLLGILE